IAVPANHERHERFRNVTAVKIDIRIGVNDELVDQRVRHLLGITSRRIAGENAVRIYVIDRTDDTVFVPETPVYSSPASRLPCPRSFLDPGYCLNESPLRSPDTRHRARLR